MQTQALGKVFGTLAAARGADKYGRRASVLIGLATSSAAIALSVTWTSNLVWILVMRTFAGAGAGISYG